MIAHLKHKIKALTSDKKFSEILIGTTWTLGARAIATILALATNVIVARAFGAEALGVLALINSFLLFSSIFTLLGTKTSVLRLIPEHVVKYSVDSAFKVYRKTQWIVALSSLLVGVVCFLCSGLLAESFFSKAHLRPVLSLAACFIIFYSLAQLNTEAVRGLRLIQTFAAMQLVNPASMLVFLGIGTLWYGHVFAPVYAQLAAWTVTAFVGLTIMIVVFRRRSEAGSTVHETSAKSILSMSTPMLLTSSMVVAVSQTGVIVLGMMKSEAEVGYYVAAVKLATLATFVLSAINSVAAPKFSHYYHAGNMDDLFYIAKKSTKLIFWTTTPILIVLIVAGKPILNSVFGSEFEVVYPAMVILVLGQFVNSISGSTGNFMNMTGDHVALRNIMTIAAIGNVFFTWQLTSAIGVLGAAVATAGTTLFWNLLCLGFIQHKYGETIGHVPGLKFVVNKLRTG